MTCAELFGNMQQALDITLGYMRTRVQFGKAIGSYQALQHRSVDLWIQKELSMVALEKVLPAAEQEASQKNSAKNDLWHNAQTDEAQRERIMATEFKANQKVEVSRFKGLGEMNASQLKETTMEPTKRVLLKVALGDGDRSMIAVSCMVRVFPK